MWGMSDSLAVAAIAPLRSRLEPGTRVDVRDRFQGRWARGFEIASVTEDGYEVRRLSDSSIVPGRFGREELRRESRRQTFWWR